MNNKQEFLSFFEMQERRKAYEFANRAKKNGLESLYNFLKPLADEKYAKEKGDQEEVSKNHTLVVLAEDEAWQQFSQTENVEQTMKL